MLAVYKKELRSYFTSLIGYVFIAFFLAIIGLYFYLYNISYGYPNFEYVLSGTTFAFMILIPIITMRVMAEENRQKTDQLLLTAPVPTRAIILGKYFALMSVYGIVMLVTCFYPLIITKFGTVNLKIAYASILGYYLLGGALMAVGLFVSTCTENQLVAAVITFIIVLVSMLMEGIAGLFPTDNKTAWLVFSVILLIACAITYAIMHNVIVSLGIAAIGEVILTALYIIKPTLYDGLIVKVFDWFSVITRFDNFTGGILDVSSIVYYVSFIFIFIFLAIQCLNKRRWS